MAGAFTKHTIINELIPQAAADITSALNALVRGVAAGEPEDVLASRASTARHLLGNRLTQLQGAVMLLDCVEPASRALPAPAEQVQVASHVVVTAGEQDA